MRITITQTGPDREFNESCLCVLSAENAFFNTVQSDEKVNFRCAQISFNHIHIALWNGYFIGCNSKLFDEA
ncbi:hypothetical protein II582_04460 [bacterium]|nr:hypothetical protein [bacterium]